KGGGLDWLEPRRFSQRWQITRTGAGLASGRAGIALFFAAMALCTGEARHHETARRAFAWQASLFEDARAWSVLLLGAERHPRGRLAPPMPEDEAHGSELGFCRGAAGRDLARALSGAALDPMPAWMRDDSEAQFDHQCCGTAGRIDIALELGRLRNESCWVERSRELAARLLGRAGAVDGYRLPIGPDCQRPGLFDGLAGIGYMWLRQVEPRLASVLVWATL